MFLIARIAAKPKAMNVEATSAITRGFEEDEFINVMPVAARYANGICQA